MDSLRRGLLALGDATDKRRGALEGFAQIRSIGHEAAIVSEKVVFIDRRQPVRSGELEHLSGVHRNGSSSIAEPAVMLSLVAGSGPRPSAKARSSVRLPCKSPGRPKFPSMQRGS